MSGFGIYVHWPFCAAKCPYCDFNSHVRSEIDEAGWVDAIARELAHVAALQGDERPDVETVFFGGGTPSLMHGRSAGATLEAIARHWTLLPDAEITLEANPASADAGRFRDYKAAGINRLSLGIQALNDADLEMLGRLHNTAEAKSAIRMALATFERTSFDLIYARPGQTVAQWRAELREALDFGTEHLSLYQLTIEPATPFAALARTGALRIPGEDLAADLYEATQDASEAAGLPAYEISNHARMGAQSRHNLIYWRYGEYAGVGPGAHGRLALNRQRVATACERLPERWREMVLRDGCGFSQTPVTDDEAAREHLLMNLRLTEGLDAAAYEKRWNVALNEFQIRSLSEEGLIERDGSRIRATRHGRLLLNTVIARLAP
ncbi:MAG TPA: radical SAM family heme chaperone HemW [Rhizomicrobium sp.]|nr:radical SAM family heme chaperone HemW [Rhizomicrobium sp.]